MSNRFDYTACEPFRAWNRIEPRTRKEDFEQALRTEIHDPLWMLARQWQFGEFKGEDTGSAILAKVQVEHTKITRFQAGKSNSATVNFETQEPLERTVESVPFVLGYKGRVRAGQYFCKLLERFGNDAPGDHDQVAYEEHLSSQFPITIPQIEEGDSDGLRTQKAKLLSNSRLVQFLDVFAGRTMDGVRVYQALKANQNATINLILLQESDRPFVTGAVGAFIGWFEDCFGVVPEEQHQSWNPKQLEYQFACGLPEKGGSNTVLCSDEYYTGHLDWYAFDVETNIPSTSGLLQNSPAIQEENVKKVTFSFIPTEAAYAGMPNSRWWEFEDGKVDLGNISAETTDIAKVVVAEYALVYGNDWFVVPYTLPIGSLTKINGLVVTDVFGQKTLVEAAAQGESDDWSGWGLFNLSPRTYSANQVLPTDTRLFLPPALIKTHESDPIEEVLMLRDEMANMVWAIETKVHDLLDRGYDGHTIANEFHILLHGEDAPPLLAAEEAVLKYVLSNTVPENWIPFIPVQIPGQNRAIQLQRASMPRELEEGFTAIRPRTEIMRSGFDYLLQDEVAPYINPNADQQLNPYFVHEEEVPRAGIIVGGTHQRARWFNGKIVRWYGYRKQVGRGEGSSGLQFDRIELLKKNKPQD